MAKELILRPYQQEALNKILWSYDNKLEGNDLCVLPTGAGKSVVIAKLAHELNQDILIIQPTREILKQNLDKLKKYVDESEIGIYSASMNEKVIKKYTLATIQSIYKKPEEFKHFKTIIIDECFVAGTIVSGKKIEDIKVGDLINSFNHKTNYIEPKKVLSISKRWYTGKLININKDLIISTLNHPIYVYEQGYKKAEEIAKEGVGNIFSQKYNKIAFYESDLQGVSKRHYSEVKLRHFGGVDDEKASSKSEGIFVLFKKMWSEFSKSYQLTKNERRKSNEIFRESSEDEKNNGRQRNQTFPTREEGWKWQAITTSTIPSFINSWKWMVFGICHQNWGWLSTPSLQDRYSESRKENSNRSGWLVSSNGIWENKRREEKRSIEIKGVDSISFQERGGDRQFGRGRWVYNIEVEDNHNYFANGVLVHNCHLVNPKNLDGMFTKFLEGIGNPKVVGFTATPYRMDVMYKYERNNYNGYATAIHVIQLINRKKHHFWYRLIYNINNADLLREGFLCPLEYIDKSLIDHSSIPVNKSHSDFDLASFEKKIAGREGEIFDAITLGWKTSKSVLVFCSSIEQAESLQGMFPDYSAVVTSLTGDKERAQIIDDFRSGKIAIVFNVGVLTIGFDHPELDCIILLRPTRSIALHYQMMGRGVRTAPGKQFCKIIDLSSNVKNMGRLETIRLEKIENKWELLSETGSWHNKELFIYRIHR